MMREKNIVHMPGFTQLARKQWDRISAEKKERILANVWCSQCHTSVKAIAVSGKVKQGCLYLRGHCSQCGNNVVRVLDEPV